MNLDLIKTLSKNEPKSIEQRMLKLAEETGELAKEILIAKKASGSKHKLPSEDGILGECADVMLVVYSIFFGAGGSEEELNARLSLKAEKWKKYQDAFKA